MGLMELYLNGRCIKTTVTNNKKVIDDRISSFLQNASKSKPKLIGFDAEWLLFGDTEKKETVSGSKCATLHLCDGSSCLIIQLGHMNSVPSSLRNFLRLPNFIFVGIGIKDDLAKLEKHYGIGSRNAVELGPLAASVKEKPILSSCGVDELAYSVSHLKLQEHRPLTLAFDWGDFVLSEQLAKLATVNVYSYHKIGWDLLERKFVDMSEREYLNIHAFHGSYFDAFFIEQYTTSGF